MNLQIIYYGKLLGFICLFDKNCAFLSFFQTIGFIGPAVSLLGLNAAKNPSVASACLTVAVGLNSFSHSGFLVNFQEVAPEYAGVLHDV
ncbi:hypothetical protein KSP40_PGU010634 [Platanthera guangdongensis]|uniref:Uncharacterized protein n=1 Tax=Platanthera guangdongensis TaxID=2320717 RepID=A0ABR2MUJ8_9ASPA